MSNTIQLKRSATAGKIPLITDVELGELAMNTADGKLFMKKSGAPETIVEIGGGAGVTSVNTKVGAVTLAKDDVGLTNADDTSDADKPVSTAQQAALDLKVAKAGDTMTGNLIINTAGPNNFSLTSPVGKSIAMGIAGSAAEFSIVGSSSTPYTITSYDSSGAIQAALAFKANGNLGLTKTAGSVTPLADEDLANKKYVDDNSGAITPGAAIPDLPVLSATPTKTEFDNIISKINTTLAALRTAGIIAT